jgi:hypothetical protein
MSINSKMLALGFILSIIAAVPVAAANRTLSGSSRTEGGTKAFCKGSTPITASLSDTRIVIKSPMASGGTATISGSIADGGAFKASGSRFTFTGKVSGKKVSGKWKGPSCYGSFSLR